MLHKITPNFENPIHLVGLSGVVVATGVISVYGFQKFKLFKERRRLACLTKRKQTERQEVLAKLKAEYEFTPKRQLIIEIPVNELIEKLQKRVLSATEVFEAFLAKSILATEAFNSITEYIPQALEWAKMLDALPNPKGPLHGLPFCVKDDYDVKGMDTTLGLAKYLYQPAEDSAALVKVLRDLGGVPFCKTNLPQTLFSIGSENPVFGTVVNPHFPERRMGPGGSSSGTGSLIAAGGTVFGLGSDTGGSGRIPAHMCGISSLKPTIGRFCKRGAGSKVLPGCVGLYGTPSLMAPSPQHLSTVFKSIMESNLQRKYDGTVVPIPWNTKMYTSNNSLRIGYYTSLPMFPAFDSTQKTVLHAKAALEANGHTLVPFELPSVEETQWLKLFGDLRAADHWAFFEKICYGEVASQATRHFSKHIKYSHWMRKFISTVFGWIPLSKFQEISESFGVGFDADTGVKLWKCVEKRDALVDKVLSAIDTLKLDVIICPAYPFPSLKIEDLHKPEMFGATCYTCFWNLVDFPAGIVRFGTETGEGVDKYDDKRKIFLQIAKKGISHSIGMPIGVQVVGKKFEEEIVLRILNELDESYQIEHSSKLMDRRMDPGHDR